MDCPYCGKPAQWVENKAIYGVNYGQSYMIWWCKACDAYVGCHKNTKTPKGTMANRELRLWRVRVRSLIDRYWKSKQMTRKEMYAMLQTQFGKPVHVGEADIEMCKQIVQFVKEKNGA